MLGLQSSTPTTREFPIMPTRRIARSVPVLLSATCASVLALTPQLVTCAEATDEHHHHHQMAKTPYRASLHDYTLPDVMLIRDDGTEVRFPAHIDDGRPVLLNFIFTTCTAICPMLSQTFAGFQQKLGDEVGGVNMVSISIDPDQDTPERLAEYAERYGAGQQWTHYTGTPEASIAVQKAFQTYYVDKMNHRPVAFLRRAPGEPWVRLDGFASPDDLVREYRQLVDAG
jgi:protein SCO1/2